MPEKAEVELNDFTFFVQQPSTDAGESSLHETGQCRSVIVYFLVAPHDLI